MLTIGSKAPRFSLQSQEGAAVSLNDFQGQWVVLYFYPRDMTPGCTIEAHNFERDLGKYTALHAAVIGVSADSVDSHRKFCTKESLTFRLLSDPAKEMIASYGSLNDGKIARTTVLIDPEGVVRKLYPKVSPAGHSDQVLADLAQLQQTK